MSHHNASSPLQGSQQKLRDITSGRTLRTSAKFTPNDAHAVPSGSQDRSMPLYPTFKQEKLQSEVVNMLKKKKKFYPIAPDALIPNSRCRKLFEKDESESAEQRMFKLRLDLLNNLPLMSVNKHTSRTFEDSNKDLRNIDQDDDEDELDWEEWNARNQASKRLAGKGGKHLQRQKPALPDILQRLQSEPWWKPSSEQSVDLHSKLLYLFQVLRSKQENSYESACFYVVEIFRSYGIETALVNQILGILLDHLQREGVDPLDAHTVRAIAQFMIERKDLVIKLLDYARKCESVATLHREVLNSIKFLTEVNNADDIEFILEHISFVQEYPEDGFSLKAILQALQLKYSRANANGSSEGDNADAHPLLKKISEERWFPRGRIPLTLDTVIDAIVKKLPEATKTMRKVFMAHLVQIHQTIGCSKEQFDRVANGLLSILTHDDADYRVSAATHLGLLGQETKAIDLTLLKSFVEDPRVLVRTECGDTLKKLSGIMSDTVLKDCAEDIPYLETLSEENFSLENYLKEKNRVPTPPIVVKQPSFTIDDDKENPLIASSEVPLHTDSLTKMPANPINEDIMETNENPPVPSSIVNEYSFTPSLVSSTTAMQSAGNPSGNEKDEPSTASTLKPRPVRAPPQINRQRKPTLPPIKTTTESTHPYKKRSSLLPTNATMWNAQDTQQDLEAQYRMSDVDSSRLSETVVRDSDLNEDPVQRIIDEHKQNFGFYRMAPNRRVLVPHRVSMNGLLGDQVHILVDQSATQPNNEMHISDLNHNQRYLNEVEFNQLLSSLIIRAVQVHRQYEKFVPGSLSTNFTHALTVAAMPLHRPSKLNPLVVLPPIEFHRPTSAQFARLRAEAQAKSGIKIRKAQHMESILEHLLDPDQDSNRAVLLPPNITSNDVTHAWLLMQLLKSRGAVDCETSLQKLIEFCPKFVPLLHTRVPRTLISHIWNDPIIRQLVSIFGNHQDEPAVDETPIQPSVTKPSRVINDAGYLSPTFECPVLSPRDDPRKRILPVIRASNKSLPRHVVKFGFREIDSDPMDSSREEKPSRSRKRRIYMHILMSSHAEMTARQEAIRNEYRTTAFVPIVTRPPLHHIPAR